MKNCDYDIPYLLLKKAAIEYAKERVPDSIKFKEHVIIGNHLREEIYDSFIRGFEFAKEISQNK